MWENKVKEQILIIGSNWLYYVFEMDQSDFNLIFEMDQSDWDRFDPLEKLKKKHFYEWIEIYFLEFLGGSKFWKITQ